jgi:hypothetical protein
MTKLPIAYKKNGYDYRQIYRDELTAIYEQVSEGKRIAFEVCEIIQAPAGEVFGKWIEEREKLPSTEMWGTKGFTVHTLERAFEKQRFLLSQIKARNLNGASPLSFNQGDAA